MTTTRDWGDRPGHHALGAITPPAQALQDDDIPHESGDDRYAIYTVNPHWTRGSQVDHADGRRRIAETSLTGIGPCLDVLRGEGEITNDTRVGILDRKTRAWLVNPWARGDAR